MEINDNPDESPLEDADGGEEEVAERPSLAELLREFLSVLYSGIGIAFRRWIFLQDEINLASWQRFWVTVFAAVLVNRLGYYSGTTVFRVMAFPFAASTPGIPSILYTIIQDMGITFVSAAPLIFCAVYLSHRWAMRHDSQVSIVQHAQMIAIVAFFRSVVSGLLTIVPTLYSTYQQSQTIASGYMQMSLPFFGSWLGVVSAIMMILSVVVLIYSYFILGRGMKLLHVDLENRQVWTIVKIVFLVMEVPRIVLALYSMIPLILSFFGIYFYTAY